jgi:hypothetical protein
MRTRLQLANGLAEALDFAREGDTLVVTRLCRLVRSVGDLFDIIGRLNQKQVGFRCLQQSGVDTDSSTGRLTLAILGALAAFEPDIRRERQLEAIERAKAAGVYKGSPSCMLAAMRTIPSPLGNQRLLHPARALQSRKPRLASRQHSASIPHRSRSRSKARS